MCVISDNMKCQYCNLCLVIELSVIVHIVTVPMAMGKSNYRYHLGMLKVNKLRQSYLNVMKLENYGFTGECLNNNHQTSHKLFLCVFLQ